MEDHHWFHTKRRFKSREFRHGLELLNTKLDLVQHTTIEHSREHQVVRALLAVKASYKQTRIILSGKKFKRGGVVKGMNVVLSGKVDGMRSLERVEVLHDISNFVT